MDNIEFLAQAPVSNYVTFGNVIAIFIGELAIFVSVLGIMMLWIGGQLNSAATKRDAIAKESRDERDAIAKESRDERDAIAKESRDERDAIAKEGRKQRAILERKLDNLMLLVATQKGLSVEEALQLVEASRKTPESDQS